MIQFNLLPDIKLEYIRAQRTRRMVLAISILVTAASAVLLLLLLSASALQRKHINDLTSDITAKSAKLQKDGSVARILTVQNQLSSLTQLHDDKPAVSRTFEYLNQLTPAKATINDFKSDLTTQTITITGGADALSTVNQFADALKYTTYKADDQEAGTKAFSNVVLTSFGRSSESGSAQVASYSITLNYDPIIFSNTQKIELSVPSLTSARSTDLFQNGAAAARGTN